ncbi:MAG TPA: ABC transporter ATP-binding protein, partial [Alphaproteobacteria bacterium]|nr:ABC transporter ATP-binding protein [Alphaproteobacteria bacterium]
AIGGADVANVPPRARNLGVVWQSYALFPHMTAWENVAYPLKVRNRPLAERREQAMRALDMVGLAAFAERRPDNLSGGQQQRVALARALVFQPQALLLDEPLSALDAAMRLEMRDEIRRIQQAHGIAALHVTHDQEEALSMADRVVVMQQGRIAQIGTPRELYEQPASRDVAAFVGHANLWPGTIAGPDRVETPIGALVTAPHGMSSGTAVTVLVRPERVRPGRRADRVNTIGGTVTRDRFLGALRRFDLATDGGVIIGETADAGAITEVHVDPQHVRILPEPIQRRRQ